MKILILSDIHANWPALQAVIAAEKHVDAVLCAGDLVNYGPHPQLGKKARFGSRPR